MFISFPSFELFFFAFTLIRFSTFGFELCIIVLAKGRLDYRNMQIITTLINWMPGVLVLAGLILSFVNEKEVNNHS